MSLPEIMMAAVIEQTRSSREKVLRLEEALLARPEAHLPHDVHHHFAPGIYMRELRIPKGAVLTGKIHRDAHLNLLTKGDISVLTEHGVRRLIAPCIIESSPGIKRAGFAHEDCIWITVHANPDDERDLNRLEARYIVPSFDAIEAPVTPDLIAGG